MADKKILTLEEAEDCGMSPILDELMPNGEKRFRRMHKDGSGYIRTESSTEEAKWQNAHYHKATYELYVVQKGIIHIVIINHSATALMKILVEGENFLVNPNVHHNVLMYRGSVIHTLKFGICPPGDWHASPELDKTCRGQF